MRTYAKNALVLSALMAALPFMSGCRVAKYSFGNYPGDSTDNSGLQSSQTVCDPLGGNGPATKNSGLTGKLYYLDPGSSILPNVQSYLDQGHDSGLTLFLSQLNVPTRPFSEGFVNQDGNALADDQGNTLIENFALDLKTELALGEADSEGNYQLASISDDGSILDVQLPGSSSMTDLVNADRIHGSKLVCANQVVHLKKGDRLPARMRYYQGPRYHIALILMWRKIQDASASGALDDVLCGLAGNELFFDSSVSPSAPMLAYNDLLSRGWKPLDANNYLLPDSQPTNPCVK